MEIKNVTNGGCQLSEKVPGGFLRVSIGYADGKTPQADITFEPTGSAEVSLAMVEMKRGVLAGDNPDNKDLDIYMWGDAYDEDYTDKRTVEYNDILLATSSDDASEGGLEEHVDKEAGSENSDESIKTFRVWAHMISDCYLDVEATSIEEAISIANNADGGDFIEDDPYGGDFVIDEDKTEVVE